MKYDVFLCHNSQDKPAVREINEVLRQEFDLQTFLDESTLVGGQEWAAAIANALAGSACCAVVLGERGWGEYQKTSEALPAVVRQRTDPAFRLVPVLLPGVSEAAMAEIPELFLDRHWVDLRTGTLDRGALRALASAVRGQQPFPEGKPELTPARLRFDAIRWDTTLRRDDSILYSGAELRDAEALAAARQAEMTDLVAVFLSESRRHQVERRGQMLAAHAGALAQDRLPLAARLAALALEHRDSPEAHAVLRQAAAWLPVRIKRLPHADRVLAVVASADDSRLLTAAADGGVFLWDGATLELQVEVQHGARVNTVAMDPAGEWFASGGEDGNITIWEMGGGAVRTTLSLGEPVVRIDVAGNGDQCWLVAVGGQMLPGSPGVAVAWECATWEERWRNATVRDAALAAGGALTMLAINDHFVLVNTDDGRVLGSGALDNQVTAVTAHPAASLFLATTLGGRIWRIGVDGDQFQGGVIREGALAIERATFSPDGSRIAILGADLQLTVLGPGGVEVAVPYEGMFGLRVSFAHAGPLLAIHSEEAKTTTLWHRWTRMNAGVLASDAAAGAIFGFPPRLAVSAPENAADVVLLPSGEEARWALGPFLVVNLVFSADGRYLARDGSPVAPDGRVETRRHAVEVIDTDSGAIASRLEDLADFRVNAFVEPGPSLAFERDGVSMILDVAADQVRPDVAAPPALRAEAPVPSDVPSDMLKRPAIAEANQRRGLKTATVSPDGAWLCLFHERQLVSIWDAAHTKPRIDFSMPGAPCAVQFHTPNDLVAVGDERGNVVVCRARGGVVARFKHAEPISRLLFSPDGRFLAVASVDAALRLWPVSLDAVKSQIHMPLALTREEWSAYLGDEPFDS
jgi:WD40 repeat protein